MITLEAILCPVDVSEVSRGALGYAIALATQYSARLRVLEVVSHPSLPAAIAPSAVAGLTVEMRKTLAEELEKLVQPALAAGVATDVRLEEGYVVAEILEGARAREQFAAMHHLREEDGSYWTGLVFADGKRWPEERTTWTGGAMTLAADALSRATPANGIFRGLDLPRGLDGEFDCECATTGR